MVSDIYFLHTSFWFQNENQKIWLSISSSYKLKGGRLCGVKRVEVGKAYQESIHNTKIKLKKPDTSVLHAFHLLHKENNFSPNQKESEKTKVGLTPFPT